MQAENVPATLFWHQETAAILSKTRWTKRVEDDKKTAFAKERPLSSKKKDIRGMQCLELFELSLGA
jgi:hypothetical protein